MRHTATGANTIAIVARRFLIACRRCFQSSTRSCVAHEDEASLWVGAGSKETSIALLRERADESGQGATETCGDAFSIRYKFHN